MKMYKKIGLLLGLVLILGSCGQSRVEPQKAAETFIHAEIYEKNVDEYNEIFHVELISDEDEFIEDFVEEFGLLENMDENDIKDLAVKIKEKLMSETSLKIGEVKEDNDDRIVTVSLTGFDLIENMDDLDGLVESEILEDLRERGYEIDSLDNMENLTEEQGDELIDLMSDEAYGNELTFKAVNKYVDDIKSSETAKEVKIRLTPNKDKKSAWTVVNSEETVDKMLDILFGD